MKIWIVKIGEPLEHDYDNVRLLRSSILAKKFCEFGYSVSFIIDKFDHFRKVYRDVNIYNFSKINYHFLTGVKYSSNFSIMRFINHFQVAVNFNKIKDNLEIPGYVIISYPSIFLAYTVSKYCVKNHVKYCVDVRDAWPSIFFSNKILKLAVMFYYKPILKFIFSNANHITGCAPFFKEYVNKFNFNNVPFTYIPHTFPSISQSKFNDEIKKKNLPNKFLIYFGAISKQRQLDVFLNYFLSFDHEYSIFIAGNGDMFDSWKSIYINPKIIWLGQIDLNDMANLASHASFGVAPYSLHEGYIDNIPNKIVEYISYGLPVITNIENSIIKDVNCQLNVVFNYSDSNSLNIILNSSNLIFNKEKIKNIFSVNFGEDNFFKKFKSIIPHVIL